jgi:hypothetical protein
VNPEHLLSHRDRHLRETGDPSACLYLPGKQAVVSFAGNRGFSRGRQALHGSRDRTCVFDGAELACAWATRRSRVPPIPDERNTTIWIVRVSPAARPPSPNPGARTRVVSASRRQQRSMGSARIPQAIS